MIDFRFVPKIAFAGLLTGLTLSGFALSACADAPGEPVADGDEIASTDQELAAAGKENVLEFRNRALVPGRNTPVRRFVPEWFEAATIPAVIPVEATNIVWSDPTPIRVNFVIGAKNPVSVSCRYTPTGEFRGCLNEAGGGTYVAANGPRRFAHIGMRSIGIWSYALQPGKANGRISVKAAPIQPRSAIACQVPAAKFRCGNLQGTRPMQCSGGQCLIRNAENCSPGPSTLMDDVVCAGAQVKPGTPFGRPTDPLKDHAIRVCLSYLATAAVDCANTAWDVSQAILTNDYNALARAAISTNSETCIKSAARALECLYNVSGGGLAHDAARQALRVRTSAPLFMLNSQVCQLNCPAVGGDPNACIPACQSSPDTCEFACSGGVY